MQNSERSSGTTSKKVQPRTVQVIDTPYKVENNRQTKDECARSEDKETKARVKHYALYIKIRRKYHIK
jgi:hypothetical protein